MMERRREHFFDRAITGTKVTDLKTVMGSNLG
jgi:hypothetical protein